MEWIECGQVDRTRQVLVAENDIALVRALGHALSLSLHALLISKDDPLLDILDALRSRSNNADLLYLRAQLVYKECPDPSYYGGIEIIKHIRLTPSLDPLSLLPIVVGTIDTTARLIRQKVDNAIIFSTSCEVVKLPTSLAVFRDVLQHHQPFSDYKQVYDAMKPFVWITEHDKGEKRLWEHTYRNRDGVFRFLREFSGLSEEDDGYKHYKQELQGEMWFKKAQFLQAEQGTEFEAKEEEMAKKREDMQKRIKEKGYRFIYIDDDHQYGWSYGLCIGLFGSPTGELECIGDPAKAKCLFEEKANELKDAFGSVSKEKEFEQIVAPPPYDLVFLDLRLEREDEDRTYEEFTGIKLLSQIKSDFPDLPVIIVSASRDARSWREAKRYGADGYWMKDTSTGKELIDTITRCLEKTELRPIWRAIRAVEEKSEITCYEWKNGKWEDRVLPKELPLRERQQLHSLGDLSMLLQGTEDWFDRNLIHGWLREAFQLLWEGEDARNPAFHDDDYPYDRVILDMGLIQELRLKGLFSDSDGRDEDRWKGISFKEYEKKLHRRRNAVAHPYTHDARGQFQRPKRAERKEAIAFMKFTLDRLLNREFLQGYKEIG